MSEYRMKVIYGKILRDGSFVDDDYDRTPYYKSTFTSLIECRKKAYSIIMEGVRTKHYVYYIGIEQDKKWCGEIYRQSAGRYRFLTWIPSKNKQKQRIYVLYSNGKIGEL